MKTFITALLVVLAVGCKTSDEREKAVTENPVKDYIEKPKNAALEAKKYADEQAAKLKAEAEGLEKKDADAGNEPEDEAED